MFVLWRNGKCCIIVPLLLLIVAESWKWLMIFFKKKEADVEVSSEACAKSSLPSEVMQQLQLVWSSKYWMVCGQKNTFHIVLTISRYEGSLKLKKLPCKEQLPMFHTQGPEGQSHTSWSVPWDMHHQQWLLLPAISLLPLTWGEENV